MTDSVLHLVVEVLLVLFWITVALVALVLLLMLWPFVREAQGGPRRRRGIAPPARAWKPAPASAEWKMSLDPKRGIEETRLMPGYNQGDPGDEDQVAEGVGMVRPPHCERAYPSHTTPLELLPIGERTLWREALKAGL